MIVRKTIGGRVFDLLNILLMTAVMLATLYPMVHVVFASFSDGNELMAHTGILLKPLGFTTAAYHAVLSNPYILSGYGNTLFVVIAGVALNLLMTSLGAYALSRKSMKYKRQMMLFIAFTMYFGGGLIPTYLLVKGVGLYNTLWALVVPGAISTFNLILMRTAFEAIPASLEESAKMDGAGDFTVLFKIVLPLSMPVVAVMILYYGVGHWNAWFGAMLYLRKRSMFPLQLILREILIQNDTNNMLNGVSGGDVERAAESIKYATIVVATLPILLIYPFLQKYFAKGALIGAIKG